MNNGTPKVVTHLFDKMQSIIGVHTSMQTGDVTHLNQYMSQLEGDIEGETIAFEAPEFRAIMVAHHYVDHTVCACLRSNCHYMNQRFYCWIFRHKEDAEKCWQIVTQWSPNAFTKGVLHTPKDFEKSTGLLRSLAVG